MPKIFGDQSYNTPQSLYAGAPVQEVKALAQTANQEFQKNTDAFDTLDVAAKNLNVLDKDYAVKKAAIEKVKSQLQQAAQGRMEMAASNARTAAKDFATNDVLNAAQQDYQSYGAYTKDINDRKELNPESKHKALALTQYANQNAIEKDQKTGLLKNRFSGYVAPEKDIDIAKETREFLNGARDDGGVIRDKAGNPILKDIGNGQYIGMGKWEGISRKQAEQMATEYAMQSPTIQSYLQFQNDYHNLNQFTQKDANGKLIEKNFSTGDLQSLGYEIKNGIAGTSSKDKKGNTVFKPLPIYNQDGTMNGDKAKALYNQTWQQRELSKAVNPATDWLAHYKEEMNTMQNRDYIDAKDKEKKGYTLTTNEIIPGDNSKYKSSTDITDTYKAVADSNKAELARADKFIRDNQIPGVAHDLLLAAANGTKISSEDIQGVIGQNGVDYKGEIGKFLLAIQTNNKIAEETKDYETRMKKEAGLIDANGKEYKPDPKLVKDAEDDAVKMFTDDMAKKNLGFNSEGMNLKQAKEKALELATAFGGGAFTSLEDSKDKIESAYEFRSKNKANYYKLKDAKYAKYEQVLQDNAANNTQAIGLNTISNPKFEEDLANVVTTDLNADGLQGAKWFGGQKSGKQLEDEDYANIGDLNPKSIRYTYKDGNLKLVFRPYQKSEGNEKSKERTQLGYVEVDAPDGMLPFLIKEGKTEYADVLISNKIDAISASPNHSGTFDIPGKPPVSVTVPFASDKSSSPQGEKRYTAIIPTTDSPNGKVYSFNNSGDLITAIKNYYGN